MLASRPALRARLQTLDESRLSRLRTTLGSGLSVTLQWPGFTIKVATRRAMRYLLTTKLGRLVF